MQYAIALCQKYVPIRWMRLPRSLDGALFGLVFLACIVAAILVT